MKKFEHMLTQKDFIAKHGANWKAELRRIAGRAEETMQIFRVGEYVKRNPGKDIFAFTGKVVATFQQNNGLWRYVVELDETNVCLILPSYELQGISPEKSKT